MMNDEKSAVTLGADVGGRDAFDATKKHVLALRQVLASACRGPYGGTYDEFALILRIDGSVQEWRKRGIANVRRQRRWRYVTADIFVPVSDWKGRPARGLRNLLAKDVETAMAAIIDRVTKAKDDVDVDRLLADVKRAIKQFVK